MNTKYRVYMYGVEENDKPWVEIEINSERTDLVEISDKEYAEYSVAEKYGLPIYFVKAVKVNV